MAGADSSTDKEALKETNMASEAKGTPKRKSLSKSQFGLPGEKKYPVNDKNHAANAKARATQQENKGNLSPAQKAQIDKKANQVLGKGKGKPAAGGKGKGK